MNDTRSFLVGLLVGMTIAWGIVMALAPSAHGAERLTDRSGRLIATIDESGSRKIIRDKNGRALGSYDSKTDRTTDSNGRLVGSGNQLNSLINKRP